MLAKNGNVRKLLNTLLENPGGLLVFVGGAFHRCVVQYRLGDWTLAKNPLVDRTGFGQLALLSGQGGFS